MAEPDSKDPQKHSEREETDQSLQTERQKTNQQLAKARAAIAEDSDAVVNEARKRADLVLDAARQKADQQLASSDASGKEQAAVQEERAQVDESMVQQRATADQELTEERSRRALEIANILRQERQETDERLLSERVRSDEALATRDDFLGMASHDLRTILGGISLSAAMLLRNAADVKSGPAMRAHAEKIQRATVRMNRLIGDLVDIASIEAGKLRVLPKPNDAAALVRESVEAFQPVAAARGVSLAHAVAGPPQSLPASLDHDRILQVLGNLLSNAIKFTKVGGKVSVGVLASEEGVRFTVTDSGEGIPPDQLESVFERFWQVASNDRRGLGLGLFITRCIVEAHGGKVWVTSTLGVGSVFNFTVPKGG